MQTDHRIEVRLNSRYANLVKNPSRTSSAREKAFETVYFPTSSVRYSKVHYKDLICSECIVLVIFDFVEYHNL